MFTEDQKRLIFPAALFFIFIVMIFYLYFPVIQLKTQELSQKIPQKQTPDTINVPMSLQLSSKEFEYGGRIPDKFTCTGLNVNPELTISGVPTEAKSLVLIVEDPDAPIGVWDHWIVYNIDPGVKTVNENSVPQNGVLGENDFGRGDYGGPCPPSGEHRYYFKLYAIDKTLDFGPGARKDQIEKEILNHVLDRAELVGMYSK